MKKLNNIKSFIKNNSDFIFVIFTIIFCSALVIKYNIDHKRIDVKITKVGQCLQRAWTDDQCRVEGINNEVVYRCTTNQPTMIGDTISIDNTDCTILK